MQFSRRHPCRINMKIARRLAFFFPPPLCLLMKTSLKPQIMLTINIDCTHCFQVICPLSKNHVKTHIATTPAHKGSSCLVLFAYLQYSSAPSCVDFVWVGLVALCLVAFFFFPSKTSFKMHFWLFYSFFFFCLHLHLFAHTLLITNGYKLSVHNESNCRTAGLCQSWLPTHQTVKNLKCRLQDLRQGEEREERMQGCKRWFWCHRKRRANRWEKIPYCRHGN